MNELTMLLNEFAKNYTDEPEVINDDDFIKAVYYLENLFVSSDIDVLIYLSALNLCNAYVKQHKDHDLYKFKKDISSIIEMINDRHIPNIKACMTNDKGNIYIFNVSNIQFSFHDEKVIPISEDYQAEITWDGVKKQPCAKTLFDKASNNMLSAHAITTMGKPIRQLADKLVEDYHNGILTFEEVTENM